MPTPPNTEQPDSASNNQETPQKPKPRVIPKPGADIQPG
ncbi:hypothetical protein HNQ90_003055 [Algibacter amylolyticus]|nr:hypothetical protein [Algibacter amylolyticus]